jgi:FKBP-type peptidyl-prolyl cis-trans isomerase FklB
MKTKTILPLVLAAMIAPLCAEEKIVLKDQKDKAGYSIGASIGGGLKRDGIDVNVEALVAGLRDSFTGAPEQLTPAQQEEVLALFRKEMTAAAAVKQQAQAGKAKKEGDDFLAANKSKPGVKTLPSGLQYKVITEGAGDSPKAADQVTVNYRGTLIDGTEFDSSYKRGEPATFGVGQVIRGWTEALQLMKPGAKWQLVIPAELAYGDRGAGRDIPPGATLVFEVELLGIKK